MGHFFVEIDKTLYLKRKFIEIRFISKYFRTEIPVDFVNIQSTGSPLLQPQIVIV